MSDAQLRTFAVLSVSIPRECGRHVIDGLRRVHLDAARSGAGFDILGTGMHLIENRDDGTGRDIGE